MEIWSDATSGLAGNANHISANVPVYSGATSEYAESSGFSMSENSVLRASNVNYSNVPSYSGVPNEYAASSGFGMSENSVLQVSNDIYTNIPGYSEVTSDYVASFGNGISENNILPVSNDISTNIPGYSGVASSYAESSGFGMSENSVLQVSNDIFSNVPGYFGVASGYTASSDFDMSENSILQVSNDIFSNVPTYSGVTSEYAESSGFGMSGNSILQVSNDIFSTVPSYSGVTSGFAESSGFGMSENSVLQVSNDIFSNVPVYSGATSEYAESSGFSMSENSVLRASNENYSNVPSYSGVPNEYAASSGFGMSENSVLQVSNDIYTNIPGYSGVTSDYVASSGYGMSENYILPVSNDTYSNVSGYSGVASGYAPSSGFGMSENSVLQVSNDISTNVPGYSGVTSGYAASSGFGMSENGVLQVENSFSGYNGEQPEINDISVYHNETSHVSSTNVKLKKLPFYDILHEIIKPTNLVCTEPMDSASSQESTFSFTLTALQSSDVASSKEIVYETDSQAKAQYGCKLQLRFCLCDASKDQEDCFPPSIEITLNGTPIPLSHLIPRKWRGLNGPRLPPVPIHITKFCKLSPQCSNNITITWTAEINQTYTMSLYIVKQLYPVDLLTRLQSSAMMPPDVTIKMIKDVVMQEADYQAITIPSFKVSLTCPIGTGQMKIPCRSKTCLHLQCFDAKNFLQINEMKPSWKCPVCAKALLLDDLTIDGYFLAVLRKVVSLPHTDGNIIEVSPDGTWRPIKLRSFKQSDSQPVNRQGKCVRSHAQSNCSGDDVIVDDAQLPPSKRRAETVPLDEDGESESSIGTLNNSSLRMSSSNSRQNRHVQVECITIDSLDGEEEVATPNEPSLIAPGPSRALMPRVDQITDLPWPRN